MALKMSEQETVITFDRAGKTATVYSSDLVIIRKLDKLAENYPSITVKKENEYSRTYLMPKACIKIQKPRQLTEEQREERAILAKIFLAR